MGFGSQHIRARVRHIFLPDIRVSNLPTQQALGVDDSQLAGTGVSGAVEAIQLGYGPIVQVSVSTNGGVEWDTSTVQHAATSAINESSNGVAVAVFEYHPPFSLGSIDPLSGPAIGGTPVTISLAPARVDDNTDSDNSTLSAWQFAFDAARDGATVKCFFNGTAVPASVLSNVSVECATPPTVPIGGISFVRVSVNGNEAFDGTGGMPNAGALSGGTLQFFYLPDEEEMSVFPASGPVTGGTLVEVSGRHIANAAAALFLSQETVEANNNGIGYNHSASSFPIILPPSSAVCSFDGGSTAVAASGLFFQWDGIVDPDGRETGVGRVLCTSPPAPDNLALLATVEVSLNGGIDFTQHGPQFYYRPEAYVSSVEPAYGPVTGGNPVRVEGGPFRDEGGARAAAGTTTEDVVRCRFGDQEVGATIHAAGLVGCRAPPMPSVPEQQDIEVNNTF